MTEATVDCVWAAGAVLGEGPIWDDREGALYWVDIKNPHIHRFDPVQGTQASWPVPEQVGFIARRENAPGFIAGFRSGLVAFDPEAGTVERIATPEPDRPDNRFNDGKVHPSGRIYAGTMSEAEDGATGALYCLDRDGNCRVVDAPYTVANGPAFSPNGETIYHVDSAARKVFTSHVEADGRLTGRRVFLELMDDEGYPDGLTVDAAGFVWLAHWQGWRITRLSPEGVVDRVIPLPVARVTSCCFGGADLKTLFITTASVGLDEAGWQAQPLAGGLFAFQPGVGGLPSPRFAG